MTSYSQQVAAAIRATTIYSSARFAWFGQRSPAPLLAKRMPIPPEAARAYMHYALQNRLYSDFYCVGGVQPARQEAGQRMVVQGMTPFIATLAAANSGEGGWESGWVVHTIRGDELVASRRGLAMRARLDECQALNGDRLAPGTAIRLRLPKELLALSPGFYTAVSDTPFAPDTQADTQALVRLYWHVASSGGALLMHQCTRHLNRAHVAFRLKVLSDPERFTRCDAAVLYIAKTDFPVVAAVLEYLYPAIADQLLSGVPALTKWLAPGLGLAEDPSGDDSFGMQRCGLLAEGLLRANEQHVRAPQQRLRVVSQCFKEAGISLDAPYLNPGSADCYDLQPQRSRRVAVAALHCVGSPAAGAYQPVAAEIGQRLAREAVWYEGRCNWVGGEVGAVSTHATPRGTIYRALGPDLYGGTSGIAWFLADLAAVTGDAQVSRAALGAMRQALEQLKMQSLDSSIGLYTGQLGIALAAVHVGSVLHTAELLDRAAHLIQSVVSRRPGGHGFDLFAGYAGAIVGLLMLQDILRDGELAATAEQLGEMLVCGAYKTDDGFSWRSKEQPHQRHLTGFSHGAAGIGFALLELYRATHTAEFREAAEQAFRYERHWYDAAVGNWPDLRGEEPGRQRKHTPPRFTTAWCHGAPGIAVSRLRAWVVLGDEAYKAEALAALRTTHVKIEESLALGTGNFSLCHGLAGNADIVAYGEQVLGDEAPGGLDLANKVADAGIEHYARRNSAWPCGATATEMLSLMQGLAGIGHFYLRLHAPTTPSVLLLRNGA